MDILASGVIPFSAALAAMLLVLVVELVGLVLGMQPSLHIDAAMPRLALIARGEQGVVGKSLAWLSFGRPPGLVVVMLLLASFGLIGLVGQNLLLLSTGTMVDPWAASAVSAAGAVFATRHLGHGLAGIFPREDGDPVSGSEYIGQIATVFRGEARLGAPAEARLLDARGKTQYLLVEPEERDVIFPSGADVLLVRQEGAIYRAIARLPPPRN